VTLSEVLHVGIFCFGLDKVLMDIGVLHFIFILIDLVDKRREAWRGKVIYVFGGARLRETSSQMVKVTK
jgi:hypothetical protein